MRHDFKNILKVCFATSVIAVSTGCVDMDLTSKSQPTESSVWSDPTMAEKTVAGVYNRLYKRISYPRTLWFDCFASVMDLDANWRDFGMLFGWQTTGGAGPKELWHDNYEFIIRANDVITHLPGVEGISGPVKDRLVSECRFLRSWWYYQLNVVFGGVPYYTEAFSSIEDAKGSRLTQDQTWDRIIEDLTTCINDPQLPLKYSSTDENYGHVTKGAAYALRGKVYLWKKDWEAAESDFRKVGECGYSLFTAAGDESYKQLFKETNERCDEMIFSVQCLGEYGYGNGKNRGYGNRCTYGSMWNNYIVNPDFIDTYENADGSRFNWDDYIPGFSSLTVRERRVFFLRDHLTDKEYKTAREQGARMDLYLPDGNEARVRKAYTNRDPRLEMSVITPYAKYLGGDGGAANWFTSRFPFRSQWTETEEDDGTVRREPNDLRTDTQAMFYYLNRKFVTEGINEGNLYWTGIDLPLIRYADVLLNLAEALNEQGKTEEAVKVVNRVRDRAGASLLDSNSFTQVKGQEDARERIRNERYWELLGEDVIYFDELRWRTWKEKKFATYKNGQSEEVNGLRQVWGEATYHYSWGGEHYWLFPIPENEIQNNPNIKQNPGWE